MTTQSRGREADARMYWLTTTTTTRRRWCESVGGTDVVVAPTSSHAHVGYDTRLWPDVPQLELIVKVSPAVNEVNLGFHHVRAR